MNRSAVRAMLFTAGFALWALTSSFPINEPVGEGWDRPSYWQIGLPVVFAIQLGLAIVSRERITIAPLWVILGHAVAMLIIAQSSDFGLLPLSVVFVGVPFYLLLLLGAFIGRMVRRLTGLSS